MPRAKRRCAKSARPPYGEGCRNFHPCPVHPWSNWANNKSTPLPDDWAKTKRRLNYLKLRGCSWCSKKGYLELDHITPRAYGGSDEDWNLQWLCPACHRLKLSLDRKKYGREKR